MMLRGRRRRRKLKFVDDGDDDDDDDSDDEDPHPLSDTSSRCAGSTTSERQQGELLRISQR